MNDDLKAFIKMTSGLILLILTGVFATVLYITVALHEQMLGFFWLIPIALTLAGGCYLAVGKMGLIHITAAPFSFSWER